MPLRAFKFVKPKLFAMIHLKRYFLVYEFKTKFLAIFLLISLHGFAQRSLTFPEGVKRECISFELVNNLIVIPLTINGVAGSFILDTGVSTTILFKSHSKAIRISEDVKEVSLNGFGLMEPIPAIVSYKNNIQTKRMKGTGHKVLLLLDEKINFSAKLGMTINGIIGYDFFKNTVVKIDYYHKKLTVYAHDSFKKKKGKSYRTLPLEFYKFKPYINGMVSLNTTGKKQPVKLLIDSGGSEAFWLFDEPAKGIVTPENHIKDFLGDGITGPIYGDKTRIPEMQFGDFVFHNPIVSFLPAESTEMARRFADRNGSVGGAFLRRFTVWIHYKDKEITFRKNRHYNHPFTYNMSGVEIVFNGDILVAESGSQSFRTDQGSDKIEFNSSYKFVLKPSYQISHIRKGSPGDIAGLKEGDILVRINNRATYKMSLDYIANLFREKKGKKIHMTVNRNGEIMDFHFQLEDILSPPY